MTREELLEYAALDAFGLLDEYEASLYTRSFHHAPIAIQNEILQRQADMVNDPSFQSVESPDPLLRERVIEAVNEAIEQEASQLVPLATIGRTRGAVAADQSLRAGVVGSGLFWRAAALALCAGLIVVAYLLTEARNLSNQVAILALQDNTDAQLEQAIGPTAKDFLFNSNAAPIRFKATAAGTGTDAMLLLDETGGLAFLVTDRIPNSQLQPLYTLSIKDASGNIEAVHRFASNGRMSGTRFSLKNVTAGLKNVAWQITDQTGAVMLASI